MLSGETGRERRVAPRYAVDMPTHLSIRGNDVPCRLIDISASGALLETERAVQVGDKLSVDLPGLGPTIGAVTRITRSHLAVAFPGLLVINHLIYNTPHLA